MLQLKKGFLSNPVQAGLVFALVALLSACSEQPAPVNSGPAEAAETASSEHEQAELPEVTVIASRGASKNEG